MSFDMVTFYARIMAERKPRRAKKMICDGKSATGQKGLAVHGGGSLDYSGMNFPPTDWAQCDNCEAWEITNGEWLPKFFYCEVCKKIDGGNDGGSGGDGENDVMKKMASCFEGLANIISKGKFN
jgi:hypothetical protein